MPLNIRSEERLHCLQHQRQALGGQYSLLDVVDTRKQRHLPGLRPPGGVVPAPRRAAAPAGAAGSRGHAAVAAGCLHAGAALDPEAGWLQRRRFDRHFQSPPGERPGPGREQAADADTSKRSQTSRRSRLGVESPTPTG